MSGDRPRERGLDVPPNASDTTITRAAIARAKVEWEYTVDTLPHLICLLDSAGFVVRVNRVVERWDLGAIGDLLGRDLHGVLHAQCPGRGCALLGAVTEAWAALGRGEPAEFELRDALLERALQVSLRRSSAEGDNTADAMSVAIVSDVTALHLAREALNTMNSELEIRVRQRTAELTDAIRDLRNEIVRRETAEQALRRSRNDLATLSRQLMTAQEKERKRIARELHDSVGQQLSAVKYSLERAELAQQQARPHETQAILQRAIASLQDTLAELRSIAMNLRPQVLDDLGAASAVSWFCREFAQSYPMLGVRESLAVVDADIPDRLGTAVFRSVQELLNNVAKHARAHQVTISLARALDRLVLEVADDGVGLGATAWSTTVGGGRGIHNLREQAAMTGGEFSLRSGDAGSGTRARVEWRLVGGEVRETDAA